MLSKLCILTRYRQRFFTRTIGIGTSDDEPTLDDVGASDDDQASEAQPGPSTSGSRTRSTRGRGGRKPATTRKKKTAAVSNGSNENTELKAARQGFWSLYETWIQDFFAKYGREGELYTR